MASRLSNTLEILSFFILKIEHENLAAFRLDPKSLVKKAKHVSICDLHQISIFNFIQNLVISMSYLPLTMHSGYFYELLFNAHAGC